MRALPGLVASAAPGQKRQLTVWRQGNKRTLEVALARSPQVTADATEFVPEADGESKLGLALAPMSDQLRQRFSVAEDVNGVLVVEVESGSLAARQGLRPGDVIVQADGKPVSEPADVVGVVRESQSNDQDRLLLLVNRQGDQHFMAVQLV